ncbi:MAG: MtrB/PioB family outer membrane beta-barrel protein [Rhodanobacter sp.]|nr:MtrB/PioB family outer membrane beta-barrel protein [Rhodanobacter sp.]
MTHKISHRPSLPRGMRGLGLTVLATLGCCASLAFADTGIGVDTWRANPLDPTGGMQSQDCAIDGPTWLSPRQRRTPTGNLYECPSESPPVQEINGWLYYGVLQVGYVGTSGDNNALHNRYTDWQNNSVILGLIDLQLSRPSDGSYAEARGSYLSDDDRYFQAVYGKAGAYKVQAFVRDMPNILSTTTKSVWTGVGTNMMPLRPGFKPGNTSVDEASDLVNALPNTTIGVKRNKQGIGGSMYLNPEWTAYLTVSDEQRKGERPYGGPFASTPNANSDMVTTLKPINDSTVNITGGVRYAGPEWRLDVSYTGSFYRDKYKAYYFEQPFQGAGANSPNPLTAVVWGQMAMEPDNDYHNLQATVTRKLPWNGELSVSGAVGRMSQNDAILPPLSPLVCPSGTQFGPYTISGVTNQYIICDQWNSAAALSRPNADMHINTSMFDAHIVLNPFSNLTLRGGVNANNQDYRGTYTAINPLNGWYGYILESGAGFNYPANAATGAPPGNTLAIEIPDAAGNIAVSGNNRVGNIPLSMLTVDANVGADWRVTDKNTLGVTLDNIHYEPDNREVQNIDTSSIKLTWINRSFNWLTLRANYTYAEQNSGSSYNRINAGAVQGLPNYTGAISAVPGDNIAGVVRFDMASYTQNKIDLMATFMPRDDMTITASVRDDLKSYRTDLFTPQYGRTTYETTSANLQWEWQFAPGSGISSYIAWDGSRLGLAQVQGANGPWWLTDAQRDLYGGIDYFHTFGDRVRFDFGWNYLYSRGLDSYNYLSSAAIVPAVTPTITGPQSLALPRMVYSVNSITAGVTMKITPRVSLRLFDTYEIGRVRDWHYTGLDNNLVINQHLYTDAGPQSYKENLIAVLLNIKL